MTTMLKKFHRCWLMLALLFVCLPAVAQPVKSLPKPTDYVSDLAHVLSPAVKQQLNLLSGQVERQAHAQIAVATVETTEGEPIEQYAVDLYQAWGIGKKGSDRGVLVLFAVKDRKRFISTGYGLESILPDGKVGEIGRQMVPMLRNNDFDGAATLAVTQISQIIAQDAGISLGPQQGIRRGRAQPQPIRLTLGQLIIGGIVLLVVIFILSRLGGGALLGFLLGMFLGGGGPRGGGGGDGEGGSGFGGFGGGSTGGGGAGGDW
jgi:uncharacterized protein